MLSSVVVDPPSSFCFIQEKIEPTLVEAVELIVDTERIDGDFLLNEPARVDQELARLCTEDVVDTEWIEGEFLPCEPSTVKELA